MARLPASFRIDGPALMRGLAVLAFATGMGVWGALLFAPSHRSVPPMLESAPPLRQDVDSVARWFGGGSLRVRIEVRGLIASDDGRGAALLAVNGGAAQAYRLGQTMAPGVTLAAVSPSAVSIDQDGVIEEVAVPINPASMVQGFIPVAVQVTKTQ